MGIGKYKYIFCDLDGTLLDDKMRHYLCYFDIVHMYGGNPISIDEYWCDKRNKVKRTELLEKTGFKSTYDIFYNEWIQRIEQEKYLSYEVLKPNISKAIEYIKQYVEKFYLVTMRNCEDNLMRQISYLGLKDYFDSIYIGKTELGRSKADLIDKYYGTSALVIGDTEDDMMLAKKIGSPFLAITNGLRNQKYLKGTYYLEELVDIIASDILI